MIRRPIFLLFLALQVATNASPGAALILCISDDGCASLELAPPGSTRCDEVDCDEHAGAADHSCSDIPLLFAGEDLTRGGETRGSAISPLALAPAPPGLFDRTATALAHRAPPAPQRRLRSIVLTL